LFSGEYKHNLDSKGRIIMPVKFREAIGESFVVTRGLDKNLYVYSHEEWDKFCEKLSALPLSSKEARNFSLLFLSGATDCETDKQGRFLIPPTLRDYAGLEKKEPCLTMLLPLLILAALAVLLGIFPNPLADYIAALVEAVL